ncbi:MAG: CHASE2 domain-containing protein [Syntrophothermus sp.]
MGRPALLSRPGSDQDGLRLRRPVSVRNGSRGRERLRRRLPPGPGGGLWLGLWLGLAVGVLIWFGAFERLELLSLDARFFLREILTPAFPSSAPSAPSAPRPAAATRPAFSPPEVVIVAIDDASLVKLGRWPWPRSLHARLLDRLREAGARAVGFDLLFDEPSPDQNEDQMLATAISRAGKVILPVNVQLVARRKPGWRQAASGRTEVFSVSKEERPVPLLARAARGLGHIEVIPDSDGVVRRLPWKAGGYAPFAAELAGVAVVDEPSSASAPKAFSASEGSPTQALPVPEAPLLPVSSPVDANGYLLINFRLAGAPEERVAPAATRVAGGPQVTQAPQMARPASETSVLSAERMFPTIPYWEVLAGRAAPDLLKGKVVLVGVTARGLEADYHITSLTALGYIPGVFIQASAVRTLADSSFIRRWPGRPPAAVAIAVLWSGFLGLLLARWRPLPGAAAIFGLAGAVVVAAVYLFNGYGIWLEAAGPLLAPMPLAYVAALSRRYFFADQEKRRLREQFSRYVSPQVAEEILAHPEGLALAGQKRQVTILFADIRGFTGYAEKAEPTEVVALLNRYLGRMTSAVLANHGCLDWLCTVTRHI